MPRAFAASALVASTPSRKEAQAPARVRPTPHGGAGAAHFIIAAAMISASPLGFSRCLSKARTASKPAASDLMMRRMPHTACACVRS